MRIKDIAKATHLSISTVSKALNNAHDVSDETKKLVLDYAKKVGYKNKEQRMLLRHKRRICILYTNMGKAGNTNVLYPLASAFTEVASQNNTEVVLNSITNEDDFSFNNYMHDGKFDGAFILGITLVSPLYQQLNHTEYPVVLFDNQMNNDKIASIGTDNIHMIVKIYNYLVSLGHTKIALINGEKNSFASNERFAGYIIGTMNNNHDYDKNIVYWGDFSKEAGMKAASCLIDKDFTAAICASDLLAVGFIEQLKKLGKRIPEDISVTGFDDFEIAANIVPSLTTIRQDFKKIGESAYFLLIDIIFNKAPQRIIFNGEIMIRNSTQELK